MNTPSLPVCPKCRQTDQIQKVTSAYGLNTKEWYETRTSTDSDGNSHSYQERHEAHTQLGLRLKPPQEPASPTHPGLWYGIGGLVVFALASVLCPIALVPLSFILPLLGGSAFIPDIAGMPVWVITLLVIGLPAVCIGALGLGLVLWLASKITKRFGSDMKKYRDKKAVFDGEDMPRWQRAKERWEQMYFCMRDETVFIPVENIAINADDMEKYLYDPQFRS